VAVVRAGVDRFWQLVQFKPAAIGNLRNCASHLISWPGLREQRTKASDLGALGAKTALIPYLQRGFHRHHPLKSGIGELA